ncbi:MAG: flagellar hook protein FlgE, partial [Pseudomonadota bacterium]
IGVNLPATATDLAGVAFDPAQPNTYTASTSITLYDSLGASHIATAYFAKDSSVGAGTNSWRVHLGITDDTGTIQPIALDDGAGGTTPYGILEFNQQGIFTGTTPTVIRTDQFGGLLTNGADPTQQVVFDFSGNTPTQFASPFTVNTLSQNGFTIGRLTGLNVNEQGVVQATYSNGQTESVGKVALARFSNPQGLLQIGNTSWRASTSSGEPIPGEAGTSSFGLIQSGALETSNVDLTKELVTLITAQRNFQANAKSIETSNAITQTIIQIR